MGVMVVVGVLEKEVEAVQVELGVTDVVGCGVVEAEKALVSLTVSSYVPLLSP